MNPCVRAVVRSALSRGHQVLGIRRGYRGLINQDLFLNSQGRPTMGLRSVSNLSKLGGTILLSSRSKEFRRTEGQKKAADMLRKHQIDALIPIGGDGTFHGAVALAEHWDGQIVGCPGTIDNDLIGTDFTIGFATAVDTAVEAVDKLRDTAESHERLFLVEVMGRHSGYIALYTALAAAAEVACLPETETNVEEIVAGLKTLKKRGKTSVMIIVAEGDEWGGAEKLNVDLNAADCPFDTRMLTLGHLQRGGSPVPDDRILASRLGDLAVRAILDGQSGVMAGLVGGRSRLTPFAETYASHKPVPDELIELLETMAK